VLPDVTLQTIEDKTVIVVEVMSGSMPPYYIKSKGMTEGTYVRVSGTTRQVENYMLKELILEGQNRYYDSEPCKNMSATDAGIEQLCRNMKEVAVKNTWQDSEKAKIKDITKNTLLSWGVLTEVNGVVLPTNAYALLTGTMYQQPVIQCAVFKGTDRAYFVDRREFEGAIHEQVEAAFQYVLEKINMGMKIQGIYRQDVYELPPDSVRELIANAVAHRSYLEPGNIQVAIYDDRLEVTSPGMLLNNVTIQKMLEGYSKPRNPAIARAFAYMKIIEKWGTGIPRIFRECKEYGLPEPKLMDFDGDFRVNMYRNVEKELGVSGDILQLHVIGKEVKKTNKETNKEIRKTNKETNKEIRKTNKETNKEIPDKIIVMIKKNAAISVNELAESLGLSVSGVRYHINKMRKSGVLEHTGSTKKGAWRIHVPK